MVKKYYLNFDGSIGDFIKQHRKAKRINSVDLSKELGKGNAYISQIENGHNKKPDYSTLYEIFKRIGIDEEKIEDYLEHFWVFSPEREEIKMLESIQNQSLTEDQFLKLQQKQDENDYLSEIINADIKNIVSVLNDVISSQPSEGYNFVRGIGNTLENMQINQSLYKFMIRFFESDLALLDEKGMVNVINSLYEEINIRKKETTAFGQPRLLDKINKL